MNLLAELARYWTTHLWATSLQVTIFVFLVYAISICFKRFPARYRYILWLLVLLRLTFPTPITSPLGIGQYPERFIAKGIQWVSGQQFLLPPQSPIQPEIPESAAASLGNAAVFSPMASRMDDSVPLLSLIWLLGVIALGLAIVIRILISRRKTCTFRPITRPDLVAAVHRLKGQLNIKRTIKLLETSDADSIQFPSVYGIARATMIIPAEMVANWTIDALAPLLLHELIHIKRRDCLVNFVQIVLQVLYFYHPMVWFANWTIRREREFACDDDVVRHSSGSPKDYVRSMLKIAETAVNQRRHQLLGIAMAENHSNLGRRIRRMMNKGYRIYARAGFVNLGVIFALGLFCIAVSAQGPERPSPTAELESLVQEFPGVSSSDGSAASSGVPEPVPEDRIQTKSEYLTSQPAPDAPVVSMLHQVDRNVPKELGPEEDNNSLIAIQSRTEIPLGNDKLVLVSDHQELVNKTLYRATGNLVAAFRDFAIACDNAEFDTVTRQGLFENVKATSRDLVITSDKAKYDEKARKGLFQGNVKVINNNARLSCSSAEFDMETRQGLFENVKAKFGDVVITSDKAIYDEKARKGLFRGNVKVINNIARLSCSSLEFNLNTQSISCQ